MATSAPGKQERGCCQNGKMPIGRAFHILSHVRIKNSQCTLVEAFMFLAICLKITATPEKKIQYMSPKWHEFSTLKSTDMLHNKNKNQSSFHNIGVNTVCYNLKNLVFNPISHCDFCVCVCVCSVRSVHIHNKSALS